MFQNDVFEEWLDKKSKEIILKLDKEKLESDEMMILVLKAQSNHFEHLDKDLRKDMYDLRMDMKERFDQVDKRFEQVDKRFTRMYTFLYWIAGIGFAYATAMSGLLYKMAYAVK